jgi:hypothetical protein
MIKNFINETSLPLYLTENFRFNYRISKKECEKSLVENIR